MPIEKVQAQRDRVFRGPVEEVTLIKVTRVFELTVTIRKMPFTGLGLSRVPAHASINQAGLTVEKEVGN